MYSPFLKTLVVLLLALSALGCDPYYRHHHHYREASNYGYYDGYGSYAPPYDRRYERRDWDGQHRYHDYDHW